MAIPRTSNAAQLMVTRPPIVVVLFPTLLLFLISSNSNSNVSADSHHHNSRHYHRHRKSVSSFFIFGDSYLDAGNNDYISTIILDKANFWPYGMTFFNRSTGRFSNGRLISDFIAEYANLPLIPPFLQPGRSPSLSLHGVNFASAGAGALSQTFKGDVISLQTQLINYKKVRAEMKHKFGKSKAMSIIGRAVYMFSIGTNDYLTLALSSNSSSSSSSSIAQDDYIGMVNGNISITVREIYKMGGRKFGFLNVPPIGCLPGIHSNEKSRRQDCHKSQPSRNAALHNQAFRKLVTQLEADLRGFKFLLFDLYSSLLCRINHPTSYGFKEGKIACCGSGEFRGMSSCGGRFPKVGFELCSDVGDYVFWDSFHLTEKVNKEFADYMWKGSTCESSHTSCDVGGSLLLSSSGLSSLKELFSVMVGRHH